MLNPMSGTGADVRKLKTVADLYAIPEDQRFHELIAGEIVPKAAPSGEHGTAQARLGAAIGAFDRRPAADGPGGWWLAIDVDVMFSDHELYRPDLVGWRRDLVPDRPRGMPVSIRPDWVCEVMSPSNARQDRFVKLNAYHRFEVPHYWMIDPAEETLSIYRQTADGYLLVLAADAEQRVRAEPFDAIEIFVGALFGRDD
jgi:Uma2 family endonuclease